jgi:hypothetical protein
LSKALNNVYFGNYRVLAKVVRFDRFDNYKEVVKERAFRVGEIEEGEQVLEGEKSELVGKVVGGDDVKEEAKLREGGSLNYVRKKGELREWWKCEGKKR